MGPITLALKRSMSMQEHVSFNNSLGSGVSFMGIPVKIDERLPDGVVEVRTRHGSGTRFVAHGMMNPPLRSYREIDPLDTVDESYATENITLLHKAMDSVHRITDDPITEISEGRIDDGRGRREEEMNKRRAHEECVHRFGQSLANQMMEELYERGNTATDLYHKWMSRHGGRGFGKSAAMAGMREMYGKSPVSNFIDEFNELLYGNDKVETALEIGARTQVRNALPKATFKIEPKAELNFPKGVFRSPHELEVMENYRKKLLDSLMNPPTITKPKLTSLPTEPLPSHAKPVQDKPEYASLYEDCHG